MPQKVTLDFLQYSYNYTVNLNGLHGRKLNLISLIHYSTLCCSMQMMKNVNVVVATFQKKILSESLRK